ncbi:hypothetical protein [Stenotrophomonas sp. 24(2023)]|uniref:hypothetical protein n=1 Tax=Stenotrophomonas sp. 24(2023) TaxID=3068324 RepID=UPI0027E03213|nr:hypothetical protein [Stenotrophomonas sp. 24(2023)]WMJ68809.1 hypothetical protein Q9R17_16730 [Stenotrophomonas sp. 24(2023)]
MSLRSLFTASTLGMVLALGSLGPVDTARADVPGFVTECVPFQVGRGYHQRCTIYEVHSDGTRTEQGVYHIDENGQWYVPNE